MNVELFNAILRAYQHAKNKHPFFAENFYHVVSLATEELGEMAKAVNDGDLAAAKAEALDTIAVLARLVEQLEDL